MYGRYTFNVYDTNSTIARTRKTCTFERSTLDDGRVSTNQPQSRGEALPSPSPAPSPATPSHCLPRHHVVSPLLVFSVSLVLARLHVCFLSFPHLCLRQSASQLVRLFSVRSGRLRARHERLSATFQLDGESVRRDPLCIFTYTKTRFARGESCGEFVAALRRASIKLLLQTR